MSSYLDQAGTQYLWGKIKTWVGSQGYLKSHQTVTDASPTLSWGATSKVATIGNTDIHVKMPSNPNTDTKVTQIKTTVSGVKYLIFSNSTDTNTDGVSKDSRFYLNNSPSLIVQDDSNRQASLTPGVGIDINNGNSVGTRLQYDDVVMYGSGNTWDGSHSSLKNALAGKAPSSHTHSYLPLSGGTLTGNLYQTRTNNSYYISRTNTHALTTASNNGITTEQDIGGLLFRDKNNNNLANVHASMLTDGSIRLDLVAYNMKTDGTMVSNVLRLLTKKDGTATYAITGPSAFRSALGLGTMATRNANNAIIVSVTRKDVTLKSALNSHDGGSYSSLFGSNFTVTVPSGYTLLGNINATVNGHGGLDITLDGDAYTSATPGLYLFNSSNNSIPTTRGLQVRVISLFYKSS